MKKYILLFSTFLVIININAQTSFCDDFEGYQVGDPIAETSPDWNSWGELMNGSIAPFADDADVTNISSNSGINSLYFEAVGAGGPQDVILPFGTGTPYTYGFFEFSANFFVNIGTGAYFNFQAENTPGITWSLDVQMDASGGVSFENGGGGTVFLTSTYPMGQWFEMKTVVDLTNNNWEMFIDGISQGSFTNTVNQIASLDLYPITGHKFYIDDVCYSYTPFIPSSFPYDMSAIDLSLSSNIALSAAPFTISGDVVNLSSTTVNSLDINYSINGAVPVVDNLTGLNLSLFDILPFNHAVSWTPPSTGVYSVEIWASNINGNTDMDTTNDVFGNDIFVWNAIAERRPLIETFTSSTCGPCAPANVTAEALFIQNPENHTSIKYQADFPGTGDPYFTQEGGNRRSYYGINSVPRMEIDGGWDQNGNSITQQVLDDHINIISFIDLSASYSVNMKTVEVEIMIDPLESFQSNNLVVHAAIIEETTYNNAKTNGETQFEHVVKKMIPNDNGTSISSLVAGQQNTLNLAYTFNGDYRLPMNASDPIIHSTEHSVEDFSNLMVAVWVQDAVTKEVHQSTMSTLTSFTPLSITDKKEIQFIYPNPASENIYISNLKEPNALVKIYDVQGRLVLEEKISNNEHLNVSSFSKGMYQITFEGISWNETRKLIVE